WDEIPRWRLVCDALGLPFHEPAETYSTSDHLFLELDIPSGVGGTLPRAERTRAGLSAEAVEDLGGRDRSGRRARTSRPTRAPQAPKRTRVRRRTRAGQPVDRAPTSSDKGQRTTDSSDRQATAD